MSTLAADKFKKMNKARRKVAVARDVLALLKAEKITSVGAGYLHLTKGDKRKKVKANNQLKPLVAGQHCTVCAIGALFKAKLDKVNNLRIFDLDRYFHFETAYDISLTKNDIVNYLNDTFDRKEIEEIESCFETFLLPDLRFASWARLSKRDDRMRLIMENIVVGKGTFDMNREPIWDGDKYVTPGFKG
jgi:hypothetical protein